MLLRNRGVLFTALAFATFLLFFARNRGGEITSLEEDVILPDKPTGGKRVLLIIGTRPEAVKVAPILLAMKKLPLVIQPVLCITGQHRHILDHTLSSFGLHADVRLTLPSRNQTLSTLTSDVVESVTRVVRRLRPDVLLVQGDTTSAMAAALVGFYEDVPVAHVEAGLRSNSIRNPFPEEANRKIISVVASAHFAPTQTAVDCLLRENTPRDRIFLTGNTVVDALFYLKKLQPPASVHAKLEQWGLLSSESRVILVTAHRRESWGGPLRAVCVALKIIVESTPDVQIVFPVHPNPLVQNVVRDVLSKVRRVHLVEPLSYEEFVPVLSRVYMVITDSGGIQEEASAVGKPTLVTRDTTERVEGVLAGVAKLIGTQTEVVVREARRLLEHPDVYKAMATESNVYGDGRAAQRIVEWIQRGDCSACSFN